jgi:hypothetical protein
MFENRIIAFLGVLLAFLIGCVHMTAAAQTQYRPVDSGSGDSQDGIQRRWYDNGMVAEALTVENGLKNGPYTTWYQNGQIQIKGRFWNDVLDGQLDAWFEDGRKRFTAFFVRGQRHGRWIRYHEKRDQIVALMEFSHDRLDGIQSTSFEQGNGNGAGRSYWLHSIFRNGKLVESFHLVHTNVFGHPIIAIGQRLDSGEIVFERLKNGVATADGSLIVDEGDVEKAYSSFQDFIIAEINRHVVPKFSLDFCYRPQNRWPCRFPKTVIDKTDARF